MSTFKNFRVVEPTAQQCQEDIIATGRMYKYLLSEDGLYWYDCISSFSDDTIKIMYGSDGVICGLVDKPNPYDGDKYDASLLDPENCSVTEIPLTEYPNGVTNDGTWVYLDGKILQKI